MTSDTHARLAANGTPLQKHSLFFDRDGDGYVSMLDTFRGMRAIGLNLILSVLATLIINLSLSWWTSESWLPTTTINLKHVERSRHGSDSRIYDPDGNFVQERFDAFWAKYDSQNKGYVDWSTLWRRIKAERDTLDLFGWMATFLEWGLLYWVASENGKLSKEAVRGNFDGSLFYDLEEKEKKRAGSQKKKQS